MICSPLFNFVYSNYDAKSAIVVMYVLKQDGCKKWVMFVLMSSRLVFVACFSFSRSRSLNRSFL